MARKRRKKKDQSPKLTKQQRRAEKAQPKRGQTSSSTRSVRPRDDEVLEDMMPLFMKEGSGFTDFVPNQEDFLMLMLGSGDLIIEPEFDEVIIDPLLCMQTLAEVSNEMDFDPLTQSLKDDDEIRDRQREIFEECAGRQLTVELRGEILDSLNNLRLRFKSEKKIDQTARAAALQSFLSKSKSNNLWSMAGIVVAIFQRSLQIGFELFEESDEINEIIEQSGDHASFKANIAQSPLTQKTEALLKKVPGLNKFMEDQIDRTLDEGQQALFSGDLLLGLFDEEEILAGRQIFIEIFGDDIEQAKENPQKPAPFSKDKGEMLVKRSADYIEKLFDHQRLNHLRARIDAVLTGRAFEDKWYSFILLLADRLNAPDALEYEMGLIMSAFLGEIRSFAASEANANDSTDETSHE